MTRLFKVLVCGGRKYFNRRRVTDVMEAVVREHANEGRVVLFIHGDAPGADTLCGLAARERGWHAAAVPARWGVHGNAAGPIRNGVMAALEPHLCIAFPGSKGTADMKKQVRAAGVPVREINDR